MPSVSPHRRAKLGYGLLSGEYSKPAPDPGDDNGTAEPRVRPDANGPLFTVFLDGVFCNGCVGTAVLKGHDGKNVVLVLHRSGLDLFFSCTFQGDQVGIAPRMFKALVGQGHPEFSTNRQQDAQEFLLHFINMVEVRLHLVFFFCLFGCT